MRIRRQSHILTQPAKQRILTEAPWEFGFAKFLGRKLTLAERAVIRPIEKARKTFRSKPVLVIDPPGADSTYMLKQYQKYCLNLYEDTYGVLIHPHGERPPKHKQIIMFTPGNPDTPRGLSSDFTLMLNVEKYKSASPFYGAKGRNVRWDDLYCALYPQLSDCGVLIIHTVMPTGRKLKKYSFWLAKLTNLCHIRAEALPESLLSLPVQSVSVPIIVEIDDSRPPKAPQVNRPPAGDAPRPI